MESTRRIYRVHRREINFLRVTIESYDGAALVRTIDPQEALIELLIAPGCEDLVSALLACLREEEGLLIEERGELAEGE